MLRQIEARSAQHVGPWRTALAAALSVTAAASVAIEHGFQDPPVHPALLAIQRGVLIWLAVAASGDLAWRSLRRSRWRTRFGQIAEAGAVLSLILGAWGINALGGALAIGVAATLVVRFNGRIARSLRNPMLLLPASFLIMIAASASLLKLPRATPDDHPITWIDAIFTATSAVCVTGLTVRDTGTGFTQFGQGVILASIQIGGLGVMIFGSTLALLFGARMSLTEHISLSKALDEYPAHRITRFAWFIVLTTLAIEAIGAATLWLAWPASTGHEPVHGRLWDSIFHSVSAFCNAGFDLTGQSLVGVRHHAVSILGIAPMIVLGGLGFMVIEDLWRCARSRVGSSSPIRRLSTHSRIVLGTTATLLIAGWAIIFIAQITEPNPTHHGLGAHAMDAAFMTTTARTAGFTTVPAEELSPGSRFALMVLMVIGGSPGSTAGGIKTAAFAVMVLAVLSTVRGRPEVEAFGRAIPDSVVKKAATIVFGMLAVIAGSTLVLDLTERIAFEPLIFEVISAASTTGLSLGATESLSPTGRVVVSVTMFLGRVGALTLLASVVGLGGRAALYRLPRDTVSLG